MKNTFAILTAIVLAFGMLAFPGTLLAKEKGGAQIVIALKDGHYTSGELIAVKPDSLLILAGKDESIDLADIGSIRIVRRSKAVVGAVGGLVAGIVGTVLFVALQKDADNWWDSAWQGLGNAGAAAVFVGGGLGVGITAGALAGKDKTIQLAGKSEGEVKKALAYLRGKARIRDFK